MTTLNDSYWTNRYLNSDDVWNLGEISRPIKEYVDQLEVDNRLILVPGCGNGYEGEYLWKKGFRNVTFLDLSQIPLDNISARCPDVPPGNLVCKNFFELAGEFDLVIEQTLFCALEPTLREEYAKKMISLIAPEGKLVGVLFNKEFEGGPPFGGSKEEYLELFSKYFKTVYLEECYNSIEKRSGEEVFVKLEHQ